MAIEDRLKAYLDANLNDIFDSTGCKTMTRQQLYDLMAGGYQIIYGDDIIVDSNTADGQRIELETQFMTDIREKFNEFNNSINPNLVRGVMQDVRYQINNCFRKGGDFTIIPMEVVCNAPIHLDGLDSNYNDITATAYGAKDANGNLFFLIDSIDLTAAGTYTLNYRPNQLGPVNPMAGSINQPIQIYPQITSVINNSAPTTLGSLQETDEDFEIRRPQSVMLNSMGTADAIKAQLLQLDGVNEVQVYENVENTYNTYNMPPHSVWAIVQGGANSDIGEVIYANKGGASMVGSTTVQFYNSAGQQVNIAFDRPVAEQIYLNFDIVQTNTEQIFDLDAIKSYISQNTHWEINSEASTEEITEICAQAITSVGGGGRAVNLQISNSGAAGTWSGYLKQSAPLNIFVISPQNIVINIIGG
jgi:hypothetical protein